MNKHRKKTFTFKEKEYIKQIDLKPLNKMAYSIVYLQDNS